jgi:hypothetical protein
MAKVTGPSLALGAGGTVGEALTFQKKGKGHAVYGHKEHKDAKSAAQLAQRSTIGSLVAQWQALSASIKEFWDQIAKEVGYVGTGYHYFIHLGGVLPAGFTWSDARVGWSDTGVSWIGFAD